MALLLWAGAAVVLAGCGDRMIPGNPPSPGGGGGSGAGKTNPVITWATPAPITNPTPLSGTQLDATANVAGTFVYTPAAGTVLTAGTHTLSTTFTPTDTTDYNTVTATVTLVVNAAVTTKTNPVITWATPAPITNPTPLSGMQLDATANVAGTFVYTPAAGTVLAAGAHTLSTTFTPTDTTDYNTATATVQLVVNAAVTTKTNPVITWATPVPITNPTPLSGTQLDATANVAGTFVYTPGAGTVLAAGTQTLSTTFTPVDTTDYNTATATVQLVVNAGNPCLSPDPIIGPAVQPGNGSYLAVSDAQNNRVLIYPAPYTNGESAVVALGQPDMTHDAQNQQCPVGANTMLFPEGLAVDAAGDLFVADTGNCRVLEFEPPFTTDMSASVVIGEPTLTTDGYPCSSTSVAGPTSLLAPTGVAVDSAGDLWAADPTAGRVTEYIPPFADGMAASVTIGQTNLTNSWQCDGTEGQIPTAPTAANLCSPFSVTFDQDGDLWVSDTGNQRALEYVPPFATGMAASVELGHPPGPAAFNTSITGYQPPTTTLNQSYGMAFDANGNVWFGGPTYTAVNNEVDALIEFSPPFTNGMGGQRVDATVPGDPPPTADRVIFPWAMFGDEQGNLIVADEWYDRVVIYAPPLGPGMSGSVVIGQPSMTSMQRNGCPEAAPTAKTLCTPEGVVEF